MLAQDIRVLAQEAGRFKSKLEGLKVELQSTAFQWYPYDSLSCFLHLDRLLKGENRILDNLIRDDMVLDVGCADGDLSFFLESLGCKVRAIDCPATNYNFMLGLGALRTALDSCVQVCALDMDTKFVFPDPRYGLVFLMGILYHLKNPFYVLEQLSRQARYCLLSSRIARVLPKDTPLEDLAIAYLLDERELNQDVTNFWILSEAGLRRLLKRTHWEVCDWLVVEDARTPAPERLERDDRVFCLAQSCYPWAEVELRRGWYADEGRAWRWTEPRFSFAQALAFAGKPARLCMHLYVPQSLLARQGSVTLYGSINGMLVEQKTYHVAGDHLYVRHLAPAIIRDGHVCAEFWVNAALPPDEFDPRERGLIVCSLKFESI